jgi:hypothetical protein
MALMINVRIVPSKLFARCEAKIKGRRLETASSFRRNIACNIIRQITKRQTIGERPADDQGPGRPGRNRGGLIMPSAVTLEAKWANQLRFVRVERDLIVGSMLDADRGRS